MEQEIKDIIAKNLPQHVGDVLRERLSKADNDAFRIERLEDFVVQKDVTINELTAEIRKLTSMLDTQTDLKERERKVQERENQFELEIMKLKLESAEKKTDLMSGLVNTVFRSPVYRKHIENMTLSSYDNMGRMNTTGAVPTNIIETQE